MKLNALFMLTILLSGCNFGNFHLEYIASRKFEYCILLDMAQEINDGEKLGCWIKWLYYNYDYASEERKKYGAKRVNDIYSIIKFK